ncbi:HpcH/HpaI aldolase family protein [Effusibacillus dendaii]|uniref:2,4-dihydroxyhept-2-ene-1,7-dioic acid aldolase n=1 Tax=Effusibacillus dendaii TaxID=2743772 RepID=A0A7I8DAC6_9BACL|nr:aldolase/citrate lyase family protein [Effusibacillus dendaii]BCJ85480.1 2,4-dihydroxyhept-2-ene-1,7-dioic acid aldolase [Effusibacillus dendaii]
MIKERLQAGETVIGTWVRIAHPTVIEVLGRAGFDFLHLDMEHGPIGTAELNQLLLACKYMGIPSIVRVPGQDGTIIGRTLDMGASGVIVPQLHNGEEARRIIEAARFYPQGLRGIGGACRADSYGQADTVSFLASANRETILALQVETKQAVERLDEILEVSQDAVDVYYMGPADLSQALGIPGKFDDSLLWETIQWVTKRVRSRGKAVGIQCPDIRLIPQLQEMGIQYITCSMDIGLLSAGAESMLQTIKNQG